MVILNSVITQKTMIGNGENVLYDHMLLAKLSLRKLPSLRWRFVES